MKVILQEDVPHLGSVGDLVNVSDGFGRNFLIPRGMAMLADEGNVRRLNHQRRVTEHKKKKLLTEATAAAEKLNSTAISIRRRAGDDDKLFGSVTNRDIAAALAEDGFSLDRRDILLDEPIHAIGVFNVDVKLPMGVKAQVKVYVIRE